MISMRRRAAALLSFTLLLTACSSGGSHTLLPQNGATQGATLPTPQSKSPGLVRVPPMVKTAILPSSAMQTVHGVKPQIAMGGITYSQVPGAASQAAAAPDGSLWVLSTQPAGADKYIWHYSGGTWTNISGLASRLSVAPNGTLYALNSSGAAYSYSGGIWTGLGGGCRDLTAASDGSLYVISNSATADGAIWHYASGTWTQQPGSGNRIVASWDTRSYTIPSGTISPGGFYVLNSIGNIYYLSGSQYVQLPGTASDLAAINGGVFALGYPANTNGNTIYYYDLDTPGWSTPGGAGSAISSNGSTLYVVASSNAIYSGPLNPTNGALTVQLSSLSGAAKSAVITVGGTPLPVATIPPGCGSTCSITEPASAGPVGQPVQVSTYQAANGTGTPLNIGSNTGTIINGQQTTVTIALSPVMASYSVSLNPATVQEGFGAQVAVNVNAFDASGAAISGAFVSPTGTVPSFGESIADATGQTTILATPAPNVAGSIQYSGAGTGPSTVTVTNGSTSHSAALGYSAVAAGTIGFASLVNGTNNTVVSEWSSTSANAIRQIYGPNSVVYGVAFDPNGTVWENVTSGLVGFKADGSYAGTIKFSYGDHLLTFDRSGHVYTVYPVSGTYNVMNEYQINADLSLTLVRTITAPPGQISSAAVAPDGTIYLGVSNSGTVSNPQPGVYEYGANGGSGNITPIASNTYVVGIVGVDSSGNVYAKMDDSKYPANVAKWAAGTFNSSSPSTFATSNIGTGFIETFVVAPDGHGCGVQNDPSSPHGFGSLNFHWGSGYCPPTTSNYQAATMF